MYMYMHGNITIRRLGGGGANTPDLIIFSVHMLYRKSGNFRCKNIFVVDGGYEN